MISDANLALVQGDAQDVLATFAPEVFRTCITSPPYWGQRIYEGAEGQLGVVALRHKRNFVGIDLSAVYLEQARTRITESQESAA